MKKAISCILTAAMALSATAAVGCGEKEPEREKFEYVWNSTEFELRDGLHVSSFLLRGDELLARASERVETDDGYKTKHYVLTLDPDTLDVSEEEIVLPEGMSLDNLAPTPDSAATPSGYILSVSETDNQTGITTCTLYEYSDGELTELVADIAAEFNVTTPYRFSTSGLLVDAEGRIIIAVQNAVAVFSPDGEKLYEQEFSNGHDDLSLSPDGYAYTLYPDENYDSKLCRFGDTPEDMPLPDNVMYGYETVYFGDGYDLYFDDMTAVYGCGFDGAAPVKLLDWVSSGLIQTDIASLAVLDSDTMLAAFRVYDANNVALAPEVYLLERIPDEELGEYYIIDLAILSAPFRTTLYKNIIEFNRMSEDYRVRITNWGELATDEVSAVELLTREIAAGNSPDVFLFDTYDERDALVDAGAFCDLLPLAEADEEFDESDYNWDAVMKFVDDGKLCLFPATVNIQTIFANREYLPYESWTLEEFLDYAENLPDGKYLQLEGDDMLTLTLSANLSRFVDFESGECGFDGEEFARLLEFAKNQQGASLADTFSTEEFLMSSPYLRRGEVMISEIYDVRDIISYLYMYYTAAKAPEDVVSVGFPSDGSGVLMTHNKSLAISKDTLVMDGAWQLLVHLADNIVDDVSSFGGIPLSYEALEYFKSTEVGRNCYFQYAGGYQSWAGGIGFANEEQMFPASEGYRYIVAESDLDYITDLLSVANVSELNSSLGKAIMNIISEEAEVYFAGEKSLAETQELIQNRVSLLVSERS